MRTLVFAVLLACCGCSAESDGRITPKEPEFLVPDHSLPAFGGQLVGTDRGEFVGKLMFQDEAGDLQTLLDENVHGIVENPAGIFVFTGLAHLGGNEGYVYVVSLGADERVKTDLLGHLPGAPSQVTLQPDGSATFLVYSGFSGDRQLYECYSLTGNIVRRSHDCLPPKAMGPNNSFKPKPLRGSA